MGTSFPIHNKHKIILNLKNVVVKSYARLIESFFVIYQVDEISWF